MGGLASVCKNRRRTVGVKMGMLGNIGVPTELYGSEYLGQNNIKRRLKCLIKSV